VDVDDPKSTDLRKHELIGNVETTIAKVVGSRHGRWEAELENLNQGEQYCCFSCYITIVLIETIAKDRGKDTEPSSSQLKRRKAERATRCASTSRVFPWLQKMAFLESRIPTLS
jgi:hypothetical protein